MKTILVILSIAGLMAFTSAGTDNKEVAGLLKNQQTRQQIYQAIQSNPALLSEFMKEMYSNHGALMTPGYMQSMMQYNPAVMQRMLGNMVGICATDSVMGRSLENDLSRYPGMMRMMNGYRYGNGMMGGYGPGMMMGGYGHMMYPDNSRR